MKKVLITGANGYIGSRMVTMFAEEGYVVCGHVYPTIPQNTKWTNKLESIIVGDLRDGRTIDKITDNYYDAVIHLVSLDHFQSQSLPVTTVNSINVLPTWTLLSSFSKKNNLEKFIYFSTVQVYGKNLAGLISEDQKLNPSNNYGLTHQLSEYICNYFSETSDIKCINLRLSNSYGRPVFGDANCWWLVLNDLCRQAVVNQQIMLTSDGSPRRDFIHHADIFKALKIIIANKIEFGTINLASGITYSILDLAHLISRIYFERYKINVSIEHKNCKHAVVSKNIKFDTNRLKLCGVEVKSELSSGIIEMFNYLA